MTEDGQRGGLDVARDGPIVTATFGGPPENILSGRTFEDLAAALEIFEGADTELVILAGRGTFFSKGFDVDLIHSITDADELRANLVAMNGVVSRLAALRKPVIAAINGHCFGGGLELAMACHFRICAGKVRLGLPEVSIGFVPGFGGVHRLAGLVGRAKALELIALGDLITSEEALRINLVNRVVPKRGFMDHVLAFARALLMVKPALLAEAIDLLNEAGGRSEEENVAEDIESFIRTALDR